MKARFKRSSFAGAKFSLERDYVDRQRAQPDILMPIRSSVPGSEQARIDGIFPVEDRMTARIAHDVQQLQACGRLGVLEGVDRQAVAGAFVRGQTRIVGLLVPRGAGHRVEWSQVDVERKTDPVAAHELLGLSLPKNQ
jgi:hypothetical protein